MGNLIVNFTVASPAPINGYKVYYKAISTPVYTLLTPNIFSSPAIIPVFDDTIEYNGYIQCDCGGGTTSSQITFLANPCSGISNKIINGQCTQGTRVNTTSNASGSPLGTTYTCTYVWVFQDGSSSVPQTEINSTACALGPV